MTMDTVMDKTRLAAFADGELSPEDAAEVVMHLADHPDDQAYVDNLMAANEALAEAFSAPLNEPVPPRIEAVVMGEGAGGATVLPFRRRAAVVWGGTGLALAASVVLALVILPTLTTPDSGTGPLALGPVASGSELAATLDGLPSGTPDLLDGDREVMILATLPVENGFCREVEVIDSAAERIDLGIACTREEGWYMEVTISEPLLAADTEDGFVTASGAEVEGLQPFLDRLGAGIALDPATEAAAMDAGWQ